MFFFNFSKNCPDKCCTKNQLYICQDSVEDAGLVICCAFLYYRRSTFSNGDGEMVLDANLAAVKYSSLLNTSQQRTCVRTLKLEQLSFDVQ